MLRTHVKKVLHRLKPQNAYRPLNRIELNRRRLLDNVDLIQRQHPRMEVVPVLKGNAYGHGLEPVATILNGTSCKYLAVDGYFEADRIRHLTNKRVLVMGYILPENVRLTDTRRCSFVVQDIVGLKAFAALRRPVRVHIELNTGMNRLGLQPDELLLYLEELKRHPQLELEGVMTHLADADNELDEDFTMAQVTTFDAQVERIIAAGFHPKLIHIAQTAGSAKVRSRFANALRLGLGMYGINPLSINDKHHPDLTALRPVLELKSMIIKTLDLKKGDKVSYNCTFTAPKAMRVGILPLGYYEGVPRELSNKGCVTTVGGEELPILGRVCMDHTIIDVTGTSLRAFDEVIVISADSDHSNSILGMQKRHDLFAYMSLTGLSSSVRRTIV